MTNEDFMRQLGEKLSAEVHQFLPVGLSGYAQVSWKPQTVKAGSGLVRAIAEAIIEKNADAKNILFKREYDIDADDYTTHRVLFW